MKIGGIYLGEKTTIPWQKGTKSYYQSEDYWRYVDDWAEACEQGLCHGYTPPPPYYSR